MKLNMFDRILLAVYSVVITFVSVVVCASIWNIIPESNVIGWIKMGYSDKNIVIAVSIIAVCLFFISIRLLSSGIKKSEIKSTLIKNTDIGVIRVSLMTIDGLAQKSARSFSGVKDVKSHVVANQQGVSIYLKISSNPDTNLPKLTDMMQKGIKEYIENLSGIYVKEVQIYVDNQIQVSKPW